MVSELDSLRDEFGADHSTELISLSDEFGEDQSSFIEYLACISRRASEWRQFIIIINRLKMPPLQWRNRFYSLEAREGLGW